MQLQVLEMERKPSPDESLCVTDQDDAVFNAPRADSAVGSRLRGPGVSEVPPVMH